MIRKGCANCEFIDVDDRPPLKVCTRRCVSIKPVAILISDVHYNLQTLPVADAAMRMAIAKANELSVPLIVAGDLHDTKANMRAECVNAMIETFKTAKRKPYINIGNHCKINAKSTEHALNFLRPYAFIVDEPEYFPTLGAHIVPYYDNAAELREFLRALPKSSLLIMHQGIQGSNMGDYVQDKSAINAEDVAGFRVVSGHYHTRQTIALPDGGKWYYIGNPFTLSYGEADDPEKGFQILMDDGSLEFVPTNLRKHVVWNEVMGQNIEQPSVSPGDLLWIKIHGTREQLMGFKKSDIPLSMPFRLDMLPTDVLSQVFAKNLTQGPLLDSLIDNLSETSDERKIRLKDMWRGL